jgi:hypothetical protein
MGKRILNDEQMTYETAETEQRNVRAVQNRTR